MRPAEFTEESIIDAGQQLQAEGRNVTGFALRKVVGGGNPTRLKIVWDQYVAGASPAEVEPVAELPNEVAEALKSVISGLSDQINRLAVDLNDKAVKASERRVAEVIKAAGQEREASEREMADATATVNDLEKKLDEAQADIADLTGRLEDTRATLAETRTSLARAEEKQANAEQVAADQQVEILALKAELKALNSELKQRDEMIAVLKHEAQSVVNRHTEQLSQKDVVITEKAELLAELKSQYTVAIDDMKQQLEAKVAEAEKAKATLVKNDTIINGLNARLDSVARELSKAEERSDRLEKQLVEIAHVRDSKKP